ncbi:MAG: DegT/DnrJ/EryC1/StrS family aminotransferase [Thermoguttaceae bacterium]|jgi:dTDP-4-amino-4,6-dideoxygalactose transaminase
MATLSVPLNDLRRQYLNLAGELDAAVHAVMSSGRYIMGQQHDAFEREFAAYCGRKYAVAVANGTDALEIALRAAGCGPGDEVITVANAGGYATSACLLVNATPVYVDVDPATLTVLPHAIRPALSSRTKAIVVTHLYGMLADTEAIRGALAGCEVSIIEDCAQAHGARRRGRPAGSFGDLGTFSFYPTKNLGAMGDGGAIVTDDEVIAEHLRRLRQYGWSEKYRSVSPGGCNSRMDELQAAVLRKKLPYLDRWNERRREIVARYGESARGTALRLVHEPVPEYVAHLCIARHHDRDGLCRRLKENGVSTAIHYPLLDHQQESLRKAPWRAMGLPNSESAQGEIVTLPCFAEMTEAEVDCVSDAIRSCG